MWWKFVCLVSLLALSNAKLKIKLEYMDQVLETEQKLISNLEDYIRDEELRLSELKHLLADFKHKHEDTKKDVEFAENPISLYLTVKCMTVDWLNMFQKYNIIYLASDTKFPTPGELSTTAQSLLRLQEMYQLDVTFLSLGVIRGKRVSRPMSTNDCYWMGLEAMRANNTNYSLQWLRETLRLHTNEVIKTMERSEILSYLAYISLEVGDDESWLKYTDELLELSPGNEQLLANKALNIPQVEIRRMLNGTTETEAFHKLCRGETLMNIAVASRLKCRYVDHGIAYLRIGPLKLEEAHLSPPITLYHDVLYDTEISTFQRLAAPRLQPAEVYNSAGEGVVSNDRIALSVSLKEDEHRHVLAVNRRTVHMTLGLNPATSEPLQAVRYDVGGHFLPHFDFSVANTAMNGSKMVNVVFYMNDVIRGGATVFPLLGVMLPPQKGTAAFWYNLHDDGRGDFRTLHAGCPVMVGAKWIINKWFHEMGQEFTRPCLTNSYT